MLRNFNYCFISVISLVNNLKQKKLIFLIVIGLLFFCPCSNAVPQTSNIESLKSFATAASSDSIKSRLYLSVAKEFRFSSLDSVVHYGNIAIDYAMDADNTNMIIESLLELAYINISIGNREKSMQLYTKAKQLCIDNDNQYLLAKIHLDLERYYSTISDYASSINSLDTALDIINSNNYSYLKPMVYNSYCNLYLLIQDFTIAKYYANMAISYSKQDTNQTNYIGNILLIGKVFFRNNEIDSSLYYYNRALTLAKNINSKTLKQKAYRKISDYYIEKAEYELSNLYIDSSIIYCNELALTNELASLITFKAHIFSLKGDYRKTLKHNLQALDLRENIGHKTQFALHC